MHHSLTSRVRPGALGVIGNISRDAITHADGGTARLLGGAALHVALAATRAGLRAAPVSVIGTDLRWIASDPRLADLDLSSVQLAEGNSCEFGLAYDEAGLVTGTTAAFGVSEGLTSHALSLLSSYPAWHVCYRRPLAAPLILGRLVTAATPFSVDFHLASAAQLMADARATLTHAEAVFVNAAELVFLTQITGTRDLPLVVVSDGPRPAFTLRHGKVTAAATPPAVRVLEVTGAGDTLAGAFLAARARGLADGDALQVAVTAAAEAVASPGLTISAGRG